jgi:hypothetical protein
LGGLYQQYVDQLFLVTVFVMLVVVVRMRMRDPVMGVLVRMLTSLTGLVIVRVVVVTVVVRVLVSMSDFFVSVWMGMIRHGKPPFHLIPTPALPDYTTVSSLGTATPALNLSH